MPNRKLIEVIKDRATIATSPQTTVGKAAEAMAAARIGSMLVVYAKGKLMGIFTERDALVRVIAAGLDPKTTKLSQVMTPDPQTVGPDRPLGHALHMMFEGGFRHVPVVDGGKPLGVVSARDALGKEMVEFEAEMTLREDLTQIL
jgi:signal-transduction protein with cAMP-binding, CBS, and nucleotidyltransferase domain